MAKAKITNKGNVQVVMTQEQWEVLNSIFRHVRLGDRNAATRAFSDLCIDLDEFNNEYFDEDDRQVETYVTIVTKRGNTKVIRDSSDTEFAIELDMVDDEDDEDDEWN